MKLLHFVSVIRKTRKNSTHSQGLIWRINHCHGQNKKNERITWEIITFINL